jgi:hypothetical protein
MLEVVAGEIRTESAACDRRGDARVARVNPPHMFPAGSPVSGSFRVDWERGRRGRRPYSYVPRKALPDNAHLLGRLHRDLAT